MPILGIEWNRGRRHSTSISSKTYYYFFTFWVKFGHPEKPCAVLKQLQKSIIIEKKYRPIEECLAAVFGSAKCLLVERGHFLHSNTILAMCRHFFESNSRLLSLLYCWLSIVFFPLFSSIPKRATFMASTCLADVQQHTSNLVETLINIYWEKIEIIWLMSSRISQSLTELRLRDKLNQKI